MSQIQVPRLSGYIALGPDNASAVVTRMSIYVLLVPGDDGGEVPARQGFCYGQRVRRS